MTPLQSAVAQGQHSKWSLRPRVYYASSAIVTSALRGRSHDFNHAIRRSLAGAAQIGLGEAGGAAAHEVLKNETVLSDWLTTLTPSLHVTVQPGLTLTTSDVDNVPIGGAVSGLVAVRSLGVILASSRDRQRQAWL